MKQVWIFSNKSYLGNILHLLIHQSDTPPSNADTSNKNPSPEYRDAEDIRTNDQ